MTYRIYFKNQDSNPVTIKNVSRIHDYDTEFAFMDEDGNVLCYVNKSEYECILKMGD